LDGGKGNTPLATWRRVRGGGVRGGEGEDSNYWRRVGGGKGDWNTLYVLNLD